MVYYKHLLMVPNQFLKKQLYQVHQLYNLHTSTFIYFYIEFTRLICYTYWSRYRYCRCEFGFISNFCNFIIKCIWYYTIRLIQYSKYAFLGALRSSAQMISHEVSMGLLSMPVLMFAGTANLTGIVLAQDTFSFVYLYSLLVYYF